MTDLDQKNLKQSESGDVKRQVKFCPVCRGNRWFTNNICESWSEHADKAVAVARGAATSPVMPPSALAEPISSYDRGFNAGVERVAAMLEAKSGGHPSELADEARKFKVG